MKQFLRFWCFASGLVVVAGLIQQSGWFIFLGIKPNLLLVAILSLVFFVDDVLTYVSFLALAMLMFRVREGIDAMLLIFLAMPVAAFFVSRILPWKTFVNAVVVTAFGTVLLYALLDWDFVVRARWDIVLETVYNTVAGIGCFFLMDRFSGYERQNRTLF